MEYGSGLALAVHRLNGYGWHLDPNSGGLEDGEPRGGAMRSYMSGPFGNRIETNEWNR